MMVCLMASRVRLTATMIVRVMLIATMIGRVMLTATTIGRVRQIATMIVKRVLTRGRICVWGQSALIATAMVLRRPTA